MFIHFWGWFRCAESFFFAQVDVDEYFHLKSGHFFPDGLVPQDYLKTAWDAIVKSKGRAAMDGLHWLFPEVVEGNDYLLVKC